MTGPITFSNATAREQLLEHGVVTTFREHERTTGETWLRFERLGEKQGDVTVNLLAETPVDERVLKHYAPKSGFESVDAWVDAIRGLAGDVDRGFVYEVTLDDFDQGEA
jgi:hypothetical protein